MKKPIYIIVSMILISIYSSISQESLTYSINLTSCSYDGFCTNNDIVGNGLYMQFNDTVIAGWILENYNSTDLGKNQLDLTQNGTPVWETMNTERGESALCYRFNGNTNTFLHRDASTLFNWTGSVGAWMFSINITPSETHADSMIIDARGASLNGIEISLEDGIGDSGGLGMTHTSPAGAATDADSLINHTEIANITLSLGFRWDLSLGTDGQYINTTHHYESEASTARPDPAGEQIFLGRNHGAASEASGCLNWIVLYDGYLDNTTLIDILNSKHGGPFKQSSNFTRNLTFSSSNDRANVSLSCDDTDTQASCCFQLSGDSSVYCSNQTSMTLTSGVNRTITIFQNTTNVTKNPSLKSFSVSTWTGNVAPNPSTLDYPSNNTVFNDTFRIEFNYTALDNNTADSLTCSLKINEVVNITNSSLTNSSKVSNFVNFSLNSARYNWSVNCSDATTTTDSSMFFFNISNLNPSAPTGLSYTATTTQINLDWTANTETDISRYLVYRTLLSGSNYTNIANSTTNSYSNSGLSSGTTYYYIISAIDTNGNIGSNSTELNTQTVGSTTTTVVTGGSPIIGVIQANQTVEECKLIIKRPENRVAILSSKTEKDIHKGVTFEICNENTVEVLHKFNFEGELTRYCLLEEQSKKIKGKSCYIGEYTCNTPPKLIRDRLTITRESVESTHLSIPPCENNIIVSVGQLKIIEILKAIFGGNWIIMIIGFIILLIVLIYLIFSLK